MTNEQSDRLDMFRTVITFADQTTGIHASRPAFGSGINDLRNVVNSIDAAIGSQSSEVTGIFTDKNLLQENLCQLLLHITSGTRAYADSIGNNSLKEQMNYSLSDLRRINDDTLTPFTNNIVALVAPLGAVLDPFGVTAADLANLTNARNAYSAFESQPRLAVTARMASTEALKPLFMQATTLLRNILDPIAVTLKATNPDWYNQYQNVRKIVNTVGGITTLQGEVRDSATSALLYNVEVAINELGINTFTDVNGYYKFQPVSPGTYTVKYGLNNYQVLYLSAFEIKAGENIVKNVALIPV